MRLLSLISSFFLCFILHAQKQHYQFESIDDNLLKNADAVVRFDEMTINLGSIREIVITRKRIITILNKGGNKHAVAYVGYDDGRKIKDIRMNVYNKEGVEIEQFKKKDFKDFGAVDGGTLYSDSKVKYCPYVPIDYPYTLELTYELSSQNTGEMPPYWSFLDDFSVSTEKSRLVINYKDSSLQPSIKEKNLEGFEITNASSGNSIIYEGNNIPAFKKESLSPSFDKIVPKVLVRPINFSYEGYEASINSWEDLGIWMHDNLLAGRDELPAGTVQLVQNLTKGIEDDLEKARIVFKYVQENTRYISVQVGIGGIQPISAIEVDKVKYGDCKGLSNYTKALLKAVNVESYYVHVEAGNDKVSFEDDFPDLSQGNHVILAIPYNGDYYWLDSTSQIIPFGFIGDFTDDRKVLVIKPDGGELVTTTSYANEQNLQFTKSICSLAADGTLKGQITTVSTGIQYDNKYFLEKQSEENIKRFYKSYWDNVNNLNLTNYEFSNQLDQVKFTEKIDLNAINYASISGSRILFSPNIFNRIRNVPIRYRDRKLPFEVQRGFLDEDQYLIQLPEGYVVEALPDKVQLETKYGTYSINLEAVDGKIKYTRRLLVKQGYYPKENYSEYRDFIKQISKSDTSKIVLKSNI